MLDHRQKYALEMAVYELVNAVQSTRETPSRWINVESVLETIEDIRSAFPDATSDMFSKSIEPVPFLPSGTSRKLGGITLGAAKRGNDSKNRSATFPGVALAMAQQWGTI